MDKTVQLHINKVPQLHRTGGPDGYECFERVLVPKARDHGEPQGRGGCAVSQYELPPGKAAFPYHYHLKDEESYYIVSGRGILRTPNGAHMVAAGDFLFFPAGETGAHKLTNASSDEPLVYIDFDATHDLDVCVYPDSGKIGIWGKGCDSLYLLSQQAQYYDGE